MRSRLSPALAAGILITIAGCSASLYVPADEDVSPGETRAALLQGRELYVEKCGSCHSLHLPEHFSPTSWERSLGEMRPRARITEGDSALILRYLIAGIRRADSR
jgi:hypothetical protein